MRILCIWLVSSVVWGSVDSSAEGTSLLPAEVANTVRTCTVSLAEMYTEIVSEEVSDSEYDQLYRPVLRLLGRATEAPTATGQRAENLMEVLRELRDTTAFCESLMPVKCPEVVGQTAKAIDRLALKTLEKEPVLTKLREIQGKIAQVPEITKKAENFEKLVRRTREDLAELKGEYDSLAEALVELGEEVPTGAVGSELGEHIVKSLGAVEHVQDVREQMEALLAQLTDLFDTLKPDVLPI